MDINGIRELFELLIESLLPSRRKQVALQRKLTIADLEAGIELKNAQSLECDARTKHEQVETLKLALEIVDCQLPGLEFQQKIRVARLLLNPLNILEKYDKY
jgi:hypothetical protein